MEKLEQKILKDMELEGKIMMWLFKFLIVGFLIYVILC